jgi:hypothetical protein
MIVEFVLVDDLVIKKMKIWIVPEFVMVMLL